MKYIGVLIYACQGFRKLAVRAELCVGRGIAICYKALNFIL